MAARGGHPYPSSEASQAASITVAMVAPQHCVDRGEGAAMSGADIITVTSSSGLPPAIVRELMDVGTLFRPIERNLARMPNLFIHGSVQQSLKLDVEFAPVLYEQTVSIDGERLTPRDQLFIAEVTNRWILSGCPDDRIVPIESWAEAVRWLGYTIGADSWPKQSQRARVEDAIVRARSLTITSHVLVDGKPRKWIWGILADGDLPRRADGGPAYVTLDKRYAQLIEQRSVSFGHVETFRRLLNRDPLAAHLWAFLEVEQGPGRRDGWHYPVFASALNTPPRESFVPPVADLLGLHNHAAEQPCRAHSQALCVDCYPQAKRQRRDVARRIREAVAIIGEEDGAYRSSRVSSARGVGMWNLDAQRRRDHDQIGARTTTRSARGPRPDRRADHDQIGAFEHGKRNLYNATPETKDPSSPAAFSLRADIEVLAKAWRRPPSSKQITYIDSICKQRGVSVDHAANAFRQAIEMKVDPIEHLRVWKKPSSPIIPFQHAPDNPWCDRCLNMITDTELEAVRSDHLANLHRVLCGACREAA